MRPTSACVSYGSTKNDIANRCLYFATKAVEIQQLRFDEGGRWVDHVPRLDLEIPKARDVNVANNCRVMCNSVAQEREISEMPVFATRDWWYAKRLLENRVDFLGIYYARGVSIESPECLIWSSRSRLTAKIR